MIRIHRWFGIQSFDKLEICTSPNTLWAKQTGVSVFGRRKKKKRDKAAQQAEAEAPIVEQQPQPAEPPLAFHPAPLGPRPFVSGSEDSASPAPPDTDDERPTLPESPESEPPVAEPLFVGAPPKEEEPEIIDLTNDLIEITEVGDELPFIEVSDEVVFQPEQSSVPVVDGNWPELEPVNLVELEPLPEPTDPSEDGEIEVLTGDFLSTQVRESGDRSAALEHIRQQVEALEADNARLQSENAELNETHAALRTSLSNEERNRVAIADQVTELTEKLAQAENSKRELNRSHNQLVREHDEEVSHRVAIDAELRRSRDDNEELSNKLASAEDGLENERKAHESTRASLDAAEQSVSELSEAREELESAKIAAEDERVAHDVTRAALNETTGKAAKTGELEAQLEEAEKALENERAAHGATREALGEARKAANRVAELNAQLEETTEVLESERAAHDATRNALSTSTDNVAELSQLKSQLDLIRSELSDTRDSRDVLAIELNSTHGQLESQLKELRLTAETKDDENIALEQALQERESAAEKLRSEKERLASELEAARSLASGQEQELREAKDALNDVLSELQTSRARAEETSAREAIESETLVHLRHELATLQGEIQDLRREVDTRGDKLTRARRKMASTNADNDQLASTIGELRTELDIMRNAQNQRFEDADALAEKALDVAIRTPKLRPPPDGTGEHEAIPNGMEHFPPLSHGQISSDDFEVVTEGTEQFSPMSHLDSSKMGESDELAQSVDNLIPACDLELIGDDEDLSEEIPEIELEPLSQTEVLAGLQELEPMEITSDLEAVEGVNPRTQQFAGMMDFDDHDDSDEFAAVERPKRDSAMADMDSDLGPGGEEMGIRPVRSQADPSDPLFDENAPAGHRLATILNQKPVFIGTSTMKNLKLDSRAAYLLSRMDGTVTFGDLLDTSGLAPNDTAEILLELVMKGVI